MENHQLIEIMLANGLLRDEKEFSSFEQALAELISRPRDPKLLPTLLMVFDDTIEHLDPLWRLLHYVEHFDTPEYIPALIEITPAQLGTAKDWLRTLYVRILNHDDSRISLKKYLSSADVEVRGSAIQILEEIATGDTKNMELQKHAQFALS